MRDDQEMKLDDALLDHIKEEASQLGEATPTRLAYAAAHIVLQDEYASCSHSLEQPGAPEEIAPFIDWQATMNLRVHLNSLGFGIAEAMDTAQRFFLGWDLALKLIQGCGALNLKNGFIAGAGVDHLTNENRKNASDDEIIDGVVYQAQEIQKADGQVIILPIVSLAEKQRSEDDYVHLYGEIIKKLNGPIFIHWLGEMFLPELGGYFPGESFLRVMALDCEKVRGAKLSLLDDKFECEMRQALLPHAQIILTGDDFHFGKLIHGSGRSEPPAVESWTSIGGRRVALGDFSHALLGVLDAVATPASLALRFLTHGNSQRYFELMNPCEELGQWLFGEPTRHYKAGLAFLSWLNGHQGNALLINHEERARDRTHYLTAAQLANRAGVFTNAAVANARLRDG
ncbi:MAG: hypothetical protein ACI97A_000302 [Planctomycetota bacterium]|jgi:hypothetical protein